MDKFLKAIGALLASLMLWGGEVVAEHPNHFQISSAQWLALAGCFVTTFIVYAVPNTPVPNPQPPVAPPAPRALMVDKSGVNG